MTLYPDGRFGNWRKQLRSPGHERILAIAAEPTGGAAYVAGMSIGGFMPEPGATRLTSFGGEDAIIMKIAWGRSAALCYRGSVCEAGRAAAERPGGRPRRLGPLPRPWGLGPSAGEGIDWEE